MSTLPVIPPPIFQYSDKITDVELGTPGELVLDRNGVLLKEYLSYAGFTKGFRLAYDAWLERIVPLQIKTHVFYTKDGIISVEDVSYRKPYNNTTENKPILPKQAREEEKTYELTILVKWKFVSHKGEVAYSDYQIYCRIPLMLGTYYCHLYGKTDREIIALGECHNDPLGYFIIGGTEYLILLQEKLRVNKIVTFFDKKEKMVNSSYTVNTYKGPKKVKVILGKFNQFDLNITGFKNNLNLFIGFRVLGIDNPANALALIKKFIAPKYHNKMEIILLLTISNYMKIGNDTYEYFGEILEEKMSSSDDKIKKVDRLLEENFFPNIQGQTPEETNLTKVLLLAQMSARLVKYVLGIKKLDDWDNYANKRIESPARSMEHLFTSLLNYFSNDIQTNIKNAKVQKSGLEAIRNYNKNYIGDAFEKCFSSKSWGLPGSKIKENITDILKRESVTGTLHQLTRINIPTNDHNPDINLRMVQPSQAGYICPVSTPEGQRAGLIKSLALTCYLSIEKFGLDITLFESLRGYKYDQITYQYSETGIPLIVKLGERGQNDGYLYSDTEVYNMILMINGVPRGWCNSEVAYNYIIKLRRTGAYPELTIVRSYEDKVLDIYTDGARPLRPLLIIDPSDRQIVALREGYLDKNRIGEIAKSGSYIEFLIQKGALEYIDAYEQDESVIIAQTIDQLQNANTEIVEALRQLELAGDDLAYLGIYEVSETVDQKELEEPENVLVAKNKYRKLRAIVEKLQNKPFFTHCELDPTAILGYTASLIPLSSSNVAPRNLFTTGMINQSLGLYHSNQDIRFDTGVKTLAFPTRPMFETQTNDIMGLSEMPNGQTIKVAVMSWTGYNQEDGFIVNRRSLELGLFITVKYLTYKSYAEEEGGYSEFFKKPTSKDPKLIHRMRNLQDNGAPIEGSYMEEGDIVIGKIRKYKGEEIFAGISIGAGDEGIVHRVKIGLTAKKNIVIRVMIRQIRKPEVGDKFASRSAQKGTISVIVNPEDLPYISDGPDAGVTPDLIINAHSLPSRMTVGKMIEIVASKVGLIRGERANATSFRPIKHDDFKTALTQYGFNPRGNERMINPFTGELFDAEIFIGPCYYSCLGKDVRDKIQARSSSAVNPSTHEPTKGRTNASGKAIRVGTQENTSFVGHGAPGILKERLNDSSDGFRTVYCKTCGTPAIHNIDLKKLRCKKCGDKGNFGTATVPGSFKYLTQILGGMNINQTLGLGAEHETFKP